MAYTYNPELNLDNEERARLAALVQSEDFKVLQRIFKTEIDKFSERLINVDITKTDEVLAVHMLAKSAAQFYQGVINSINIEVRTYKDSLKSNEPLPDDVGSILDFDESPDI